MTSRVPSEFMSVRSLTSAMPASRLFAVSFLIASMTFSGPMPYGISTAVIACRPRDPSSGPISTRARMRTTPRPVS